MRNPKKKKQKQKVSILMPVKATKVEWITLTNMLRIGKGFLEKNPITMNSQLI